MAFINPFTGDGQGGATGPAGGFVNPFNGQATSSIGQATSSIGTLKNIDPATLAALQAQIGNADPSLLQSALHVLKTPLGVVGGALHAASLPGQYIRQALLGTKTTGEYLQQHHILQGGGWTGALGRGVASFAGDTLTDPLTYLTGGTEGIAKNIATSRLLGHAFERLAPEAWAAAKEAGISAGEFALTHSDPAVHALATAVTASPSYAKGLQAAKDIMGKEWAKTIPDAISGGLRVHIPFTGASPQLKLVPAELTGKITGPVGEFIKNSAPYDTVARNLSTTWQTMQGGRKLGDGTIGLFQNDIRKVAAAERNAYAATGNDFANSIYSTFGAKPEDIARAHAAFNDPGSLTAPLSEAEKALVSKWHDTLRPADLAYKQTVFPETVGRQGYVPRISTEEAMKARSGGAPNPVGQVKMAAKPASANERVLGELSFPEAQAAESARLGVKQAYVEDPAKSIAASMADTAQKVYAARLVQADARAGLVISDLSRTTSGASLHELQKIGVSPEEAVRAYQDGSKLPWMDHLSPETQHALAADAQLADAKSAGKLPSLINKMAKSESQQSRLVTSGLNKGTKVEAALGKYNDTGAGIAAEGRNIQAAQDAAMHDLATKSYHLDELQTTAIPKLQQAIEDHTYQLKQAQAAPANIRSELAQRISASDSRIASVKSQMDSITSLPSPASHAEASGRAIQYEALKSHLADLKAEAKVSVPAWRAEARGNLANVANAAEAYKQRLVDLNTNLASAKAETAALLREGKTNIPGTAGHTMAQRAEELRINQATYQKHTLFQGEGFDKVQKAAANLEVTNNYLTKQQAKVEALGLKKVNLEAGLKSGGDGWPVLTHEGPPPDGWRTITNASYGIFNGKTMPGFLADEVENALRVDKIPGVLKSLDSYTNFVKRWATVPLPHFWLKRAEGGWFVNMLGGVSARDQIAGYRLAKELRSQTPDLNKVISGRTVGQWKQAFDRQAILAGHGTEVGDLTHTEVDSLLHRPGFGIPVAGQAATGVMKVGSHVLGTIDDGARAGAFIHGMNSFNGDEHAARMFVLQRHGDFSEATPFEKTVLKRIIPFYKWLRVKTPLVIQSLAENPGRVIMPVTAQQDILGDPRATAEAYANGTMPGSAALKGGFIAGGVLKPLLNLFGAGGSSNPTAVTTDLPTYSLNGLANPASELHPLLQLFQGLSTRTQQYPTGAEPLHMTVPAKGVYRGVAMALEHIPVLSQLVARTPGGDLRMNSKLSMILNQMPSSQVASVGDSLPSLTQGNGAGLLKALSPITPTELTPKVVQGELGQQQAQLKQLVGELYRRQESQQFKDAKAAKPARLPAAYRPVAPPKAHNIKSPFPLPKVG